MSLLADCFHPRLASFHAVFELISPLCPVGNPAHQFFIRIDSVFFQINDGLRNSVKVVPLCPYLIASALALAHLLLNVNQQRNLSARVLASRNPGNMHLPAVQHIPQSSRCVRRAQRIKADKAFAGWRLHADLCAALHPASGFFKQLHERIKTVRLHPQGAVNHHANRVAAGDTDAAALPLVV